MRATGRGISYAGQDRSLAEAHASAGGHVYGSNYPGDTTGFGHIAGRKKKPGVKIEAIIGYSTSRRWVPDVRRFHLQKAVRILKQDGVERFSPPEKEEP